MGMVGVEGAVYVGNYGLEIWNKGVSEMWLGSERYIDIISSAVRAIKGAADIDGSFFENKGLTASIHYRNCSDVGSAREKIMAAVELLPQANDLRITDGRMVLELRPNIDVNKGSALKSLIAQYGLSGVIYIGDDVSDVEAFVALHDSGIKGITVGVGSDEAPPQLYDRSDFTVHGVEQVERLLGWLVDITAD
jgi:trehalose 6-phosphate phosphatase